MRVQGIRDSERLSQTPRARGEILLAASPSGHDIQALDRIDSPQEDGTGVANRSSHHIQAPMDAIAEVDVRRSRWPEHGSVSSRPTDTGSRVGRRIIRTGIRLDFHDDTSRWSPVHCRHESCPE